MQVFDILGEYNEWNQVLTTTHPEITDSDQINICEYVF